MALQIFTNNQINNQSLEEWQELWDCSASAHFFNSPQWFLVNRRKRLSAACWVITIRDKSRLAAVLLLQNSKKFGVTTLTSMGGNMAGTFPLLYQDQSVSAVKEVFNYLFSQKSFFLTELPEKLAKVVNNGYTNAVIKPASLSPYINLEQDPFVSLSKKQRSKLFSRIKKFKNSITFRHYQNSAEGLQIAFSIDKKSHKRETGRATFAGGPEQEFFTQLAEISNKMVAVDVLFFGSMPMAYSINLVYNRIYHGYKTDFDESFRHLSPGKLMLYYILNYAKQEGYKIFDFSRGVNILKQEFTPFSNKQYNVHFAKNPFIRWWWAIAGNVSLVKTRMYENHKFFSVYLVVKKLIVRIKASVKPTNNVKQEAVL